ncbi:hypothetical protein [Argonema galeatum]|uniref:hypothetical protein n=1 Tax=Argonema galeatum TaxID=2942762 RepID=UPI0020120061|nr:hypothetical protein [Argonema galeatum]MCL1463411.1 hypothetical protein [Argonema galeatum A003/A1]
MSRASMIIQWSDEYITYNLGSNVDRFGAIRDRNDRSVDFKTKGGLNYGSINND